MVCVGNKCKAFCSYKSHGTCNAAIGSMIVKVGETECYLDARIEHEQKLIEDLKSLKKEIES